LLYAIYLLFTPCLLITAKLIRFGRSVASFYGKDSVRVINRDTAAGFRISYFAGWSL